MLFWFFILFCNLLIPVTMLIFGYVMYKYCPRRTNDVFMHLPSPTVKNDEAWLFANKYCGRLWQKLAVIMIIPTFIIHMFVINKPVEVIGKVGLTPAILECIIMIFSIIVTQFVMKRVFVEQDRN